jgi:putative membrane protein
VRARDGGEIDYRFTLANERTFLAWIRTALAMVAGGVVAAKALTFEHELSRWIVAVPPIVGGALVAADAAGGWRRYEEAMRAGLPLPVGRRLQLLGVAVAAYAVVALVAADAAGGWRRYEEAMRAGLPLPVGRRLQLLGVAVAAYAVVTLVASALD